MRIRTLPNGFVDTLGLGKGEGVVTFVYPLRGTW